MTIKFLEIYFPAIDEDIISGKVKLARRLSGKKEGGSPFPGGAALFPAQADNRKQLLLVVAHNPSFPLIRRYPPHGLLILFLHLHT